MVPNTEGKIKTLPDQQTNITLVVKKGQAGPSRNHAADCKGRKSCTKGLIITVTKSGHGAIKCPLKTNCSYRCVSFLKSGNRPETWCLKATVTIVEKGKGNTDFIEGVHEQEDRFSPKDEFETNNEEYGRNLLHNILDSKAGTDFILAVKWSPDGELVQKIRRLGNTMRSLLIGFQILPLKS